MPRRSGDSEFVGETDTTHKRSDAIDHQRVGLPDTRDLVTRLNQLLAVLDDNKADIVATLEEVRTLSGHLAAQSSTISCIARQ